MGDEFDVDIYDLTKKSNVKILCNCDYCGKQLYIPYSRIINTEDIKFNAESKICCSKCVNKKQQELLIEKYNVKSNFQLKHVQEKTKQTNLQKYGVENPMKSEEIKRKVMQTNLQKYGVNSPLQSEETKRKIKQTNLEKYGVQYSIESEKVKQKIKQTNLEKYGVENVFQSEEIKQKIKQTNLQKYGVYHIMKLDTYKNKVIIKGNITKYKNGDAPSSKQQEYICNLVNGKLNYPINRIRLDIAFPENKLYIEYDGGGNDLCVIKGDITRKEFEIKEIKRKKYLENLGWKIIRIICKSDKLLNDNIIINLIDKAKLYLLNTNHTWYEIDFDNLEIRCSEYKKWI